MLQASSRRASCGVGCGGSLGQGLLRTRPKVSKVSPGNSSVAGRAGRTSLAGSRGLAGFRGAAGRRYADAVAADAADASKIWCVTAPHVRAQQQVAYCCDAIETLKQRVPLAQDLEQGV